jgi:hypothetical protein
MKGKKVHILVSVSSGVVSDIEVFENEQDVFEAFEKEMGISWEYYINNTEEFEHNEDECKLFETEIK